jgi:chromosome partitioning protein
MRQIDMILVVGGIKGGSGKTTIATNLAVMRSCSEGRVLLIDADEQKSATQWSSQREEKVTPTEFPTIELSGKNLHATVKRVSHDYDDVIIDVGGRDTTSQRSAMSIADVFLVPFRPRSLDIWTLGDLRSLVDEMQVINPDMKVYTLLNQADSKGNDNDDAAEFLSNRFECIPTTVGHRKAFANAASLGLGVVELDKRSADVKASDEIKAVYKYIYK